LFSISLFLPPPFKAELRLPLTKTDFRSISVFDAYTTSVELTPPKEKAVIRHFSEDNAR
jgi:hypothetical protein